MKLFLSYFGMPIALAALVLVLYAGRAAASDASSCYVVGDSDARNHCLAKARKDPGMCYAIRSADRRAECLAEVRR